MPSPAIYVCEEQAREMNFREKVWREMRETSAEALAAVTDTGHRQRHRDTVLAYVRAHPGRTASEMALDLPLDAVEVRRRLSDLNAEEPYPPVQQGKPRTALGRRRRELTWWPAEGQARLDFGNRS